MVPFKLKEVWLIWKYKSIISRGGSSKPLNQFLCHNKKTVPYPWKAQQFNLISLISDSW